MCVVDLHCSSIVQSFCTCAPICMALAAWDEGNSVYDSSWESSSMWSGAEFADPSGCVSRTHVAALPAIQFPAAACTPHAARSYAWPGTIRSPVSWRSGLQVSAFSNNRRSGGDHRRPCGTSSHRMQCSAAGISIGRVRRRQLSGSQCVCVQVQARPDKIRIEWHGPCRGMNERSCICISDSLIPNDYLSGLDNAYYYYIYYMRRQNLTILFAVLAAPPSS